MLQIIMGRAGSGKSDRVLETIATCRRERPQVLLVPEHASHEAEMDLCRTCGPTASRNTEALSFRSLARRVLEETGGAAEFTLDSGGKLLTMRCCLQELAPKLQVFGNPSRRSGFLQELITVCDEFYAYDVTPETLYRQVEDMTGSAGDKLREIALLFAAYDAKLHNGTIDARSRMQKLRDAMEKSTYLQGKDLYCDGFSFFNRLEEEVLAQALRQCHSVTVTLLGDRENAERFQNALRQRDRLARMANACGVPCEILHLKQKSDTPLHHLEQYFFDGDRIWDTPQDAVSLCRCESAFSEVEHVAVQIRNLVRQGYRYRDISVCARNMDVYGPLLDMVFRREEIPVYISRRSDILDKPMMNFALSAVDAVTGGFEYEDMFRYLKSGMAGITEEQCDILENYVITWQIRGNMWLSDTPWSANPDGYGGEMTPFRQQILDQINEARDRIQGPLHRLHDGLRDSESARNKAKELYLFLEDCGVPQQLRNRAEALFARGQVQQAEEMQQLFGILCDVLDQFATILGDTELSGEEFARLLRLILTQYSVGTIPATLDQVKVSEITRNDRHPVRVLFLLGANDHVLPQVERQSGILDDADRLALQQREICLSDATFDALDNELQNIYACLAQPKEKLFVSWPVTDISGAELRPSFVVARIERLFPGIALQQEDVKERLCLAEEALCVAATRREGAVWNHFEQKQKYRAATDAMKRASKMQRGSLSPEAVTALYGKQISMSASRMDRVKSCHFGYFMEYGLKAKERKSAGFEAPEIGTFLHYLLENVAREVKDGGGFAQVEEAELHAMVRKYIQQYVDTQLQGYGQKSARFRYLFSRLRKTAYDIVDAMAAELRESDFAPVAFELAFGGKNPDIPAITITEGDARLSVTGKVDRVDGWLHEGKLYLRVVDYKTGRKAFDLTDIRYGLGVQMLLYLFTLQKTGQQQFGYPIVPAGVLYSSARSDILKMPPGAEEWEIEKELQKQLRRSGMVLEDRDVLQAMEHSALETPCYLPIHIKKDGTITDGIASAEQLGHLGRYVEKLLHDIAREIGQGNIDADPCAHDYKSNACTYCPFASACYFEPEREPLRYMRKTTPEEFWQFVEKEGVDG